MSLLCALQRVAGNPLLSTASTVAPCGLVKRTTTPGTLAAAALPFSTPSTHMPVASASLVVASGAITVQAIRSVEAETSLSD